MINSTGFFRNKTTSLIGLGQALVERFGGEVPHTLDELVTLPGIGRKTANVILGNAFGIPGITVDTHFGRLVRRWRWTAETDPVKVESAVAAMIPKKDWTDLSQRPIWHGRRVCHARKPACGACALARPARRTGSVRSTRPRSRQAGQDRGPGGGVAVRRAGLGGRRDRRGWPRLHGRARPPATPSASAGTGRLRGPGRLPGPGRPGHRRARLPDLPLPCLGAADGAAACRCAGSPAGRWW